MKALIIADGDVSRAWRWSSACSAVSRTSGFWSSPPTVVRARRRRSGCSPTWSSETAIRSAPDVAAAARGGRRGDRPSADQGRERHRARRCVRRSQRGANRIRHRRRIRREAPRAHARQPAAARVCPSWPACDICLADSASVVRVIGDGGPASLALNGAAGDYVSLLALSKRVEGVTTTGLAYPLHDEALLMGPTRGLSNETRPARGPPSLGAADGWPWSTRARRASSAAGDRAAQHMRRGRRPGRDPGRVWRTNLTAHPAGR